jgi:hypothetical protein
MPKLALIGLFALATAGASPHVIARIETGSFAGRRGVGVRRGLGRQTIAPARAHRSRDKPGDPAVAAAARALLGDPWVRRALGGQLRAGLTCASKPSLGPGTNPARGPGAVRRCRGVRPRVGDGVAGRKAHRGRSALPASRPTDPCRSAANRPPREREGPLDRLRPRGDLGRPRRSENARDRESARGRAGSLVVVAGTRDLWIQAADHVLVGLDPSSRRVHTRLSFGRTLAQGPWVRHRLDIGEGD